MARRGIIARRPLSPSFSKLPPGGTVRKSRGAPSTECPGRFSETKRTHPLLNSGSGQRVHFSRSPDFVDRQLSRQPSQGKPPNDRLAPRAKPPHIQWRYRPGFPPGSLFSPEGALKCSIHLPLPYSIFPNLSSGKLILPGRAWSQCVTGPVYCPGLLGGQLGNDTASKYSTHRVLHSPESCATMEDTWN